MSEIYSKQYLCPDFELFMGLVESTQSYVKDRVKGVTIRHRHDLISEIWKYESYITVAEVKNLIWCFPVFFISWH